MNQPLKTSSWKQAIGKGMDITDSQTKWKLMMAVPKVNIRGVTEPKMG